MSSAKTYLGLQKAIQDDRNFWNGWMNGIDNLNDIVKGVVPSTKEEYDKAYVALEDLHNRALVERKREDKRQAKRLARKSKVVRGGRP